MYTCIEYQKYFRYNQSKIEFVQSNMYWCIPHQCSCSLYTVKLGDKDDFDKEQIGVFKELFVNYQPFDTINQLLDKELLPI